MSPALARFFILLLVLVSFSVNVVLTAYSPRIPPSPALHSLSNSLTPSLAHPPSVDTSSPAPTNSLLGSSPLAPTPKNPHPDSSPSPLLVADADSDGVTCIVVTDDDNKSSRGMSTGKKAGIAVVI